MTFQDLYRDDRRVYSFDIFDTVLIREVGHPTTIFSLMAERIPADLDLPPALKNNFRLERVQAEAEARQHPDCGEEVSLDAIYQSLAKTHAISAAVVERLKELEVQTERDYIVPVPGMNDSIRQLREHGRRIVFSSDMYLPERFLMELLRQHGLFQDGDGIYVSSTIGRTKSSGSLFQYILERENLPAAALCHVGNQPVDDAETPTRLGIQAVCFHAGNLSPTERKIFESDQSVEASCTSGVIRLARLAESPAEANTANDLGREMAGPILTTYVQWLLAQAAHDHVQGLYFVARDGQVLLEIARRLGTTIPLHYLYGSRQSWHIGSIQSFGPRELDWALERDPFLTLESIARRLTISVEDVRQTLDHLGYAVSPTENLPASKMPVVEQALLHPDIQQKISMAADSARNLAQRYLQQMGITPDQRIGFVDIGWKGRLQDSMVRLCTPSAPPTVIGYYFGLTTRTSDTNPERNAKRCFFFSPDDSGRTKQAGLQFANILEILTAADHGSTIGYQPDRSGTIQPVLRHERNDGALDWGLEAMRSGLMSYVTSQQQFGARHHRAVCSPALIQELLLSWYEHPTLAQAHKLGSFPFSSDQAETQIRHFAPPFTLRQACRYLWASLFGRRQHARQQLTYWPQGSRIQSSAVSQFIMRLADAWYYSIR